MRHCWHILTHIVQRSGSTVYVQQKYFYSLFNILWEPIVLGLQAGLQSISISRHSIWSPVMRYQASLQISSASPCLQSGLQQLECCSVTWRSAFPAKDIPPLHPEKLFGCFAEEIWCIWLTLSTTNAPVHLCSEIMDKCQLASSTEDRILKP